ncbi:MAG: hypothetical protein JWP57_4011, partial [Spirosoma sp.]|nr:hypothetical protein [Spirosoma sp.]
MTLQVQWAALVAATFEIGAREGGEMLFFQALNSHLRE